MKIRKIKDKDYYLFDNETEFQQWHPKQSLLHDWRNGEEGEWVLCDDGQVCQVIKRGSLKKSNIYVDYIRTVIGSFVCSKTAKMKGAMRKNMYSFGAQDKTTYEIVKERKNPTTKEFLFAKYVAKGENIVEAFMKVYPAKSEKHAKKGAKLLMSTKRIQGLVKEEIEKVMNEAEITPLYILEKMKDIIESDASRDSDKVSLLKELVAISGMRDTEKKSESVTVFQGFSSDQLDAISGNNTKKLAEAKREIES